MTIALTIDDTARQMWTAFGRGDSVLAERLAKGILCTDRHHARARLIRAAIEAQRGNTKTSCMQAIQAAAFGPDDADVQRAAGRILLEAGELGAALDCYGQSRIAGNGDLAATMDLAYARLFAGDWTGGFHLHEARIQREIKRTGLIPRKPRWDGSETGTLLVMPEGGYGDMIMMARFLGEAAKRCDKVVAKIPKSLERLFRGLGVDLDHGPKDQIPEHDAWCFALSLPFCLGMEQPSGAPYFPMPVVPSAAHGRPAVGIAWGGSPLHPRDGQRSLPAEHLKRLLDAPVDWHSLQIGPHAADLPRGAPVIEHEVRDWHDTASIIAGLDLVVTVDTAVAHLAGAMGKPTWIMLPTAPEWRWGHGGEDSPWYDSVRLFRQSRAGQWGDVVERVVQQFPETPGLGAFHHQPADGNAHLTASAGDA